jgi:hypothetical protein
MKPLCVDLYCGLGGWSEGFLSEGYDCIGFDIERHDYGVGGYPGQLVLQDVLTLHGSQFRGAACIVASPPCQNYSYMAMPWKRAKVEAEWQLYSRDSDSPFADRFGLNDLFDACFRIQREASAAAGRLIPMVVENVKGAQRWVGAARWHFGSYYLWGDVPALMPFTRALKGRSNGVKQGGSGAEWFDKALDERRSGVSSADTFRIDGTPGQLRSPDLTIGSGIDVLSAGARAGGTKVGGEWFGSYAEQKAAGTISPMRLYSSHSDSRKAASAQIAKIPFDLAAHVARCFHPVNSATLSR